MMTTTLGLKPLGSTDDDNDMDSNGDNGKDTNEANGNIVSSYDIRRPLAVRMRPEYLDDVIGQDAALVSGSPLRVMAMDPSRNMMTSPSAVILYGPPGVGKTTLAHIVANESHRRFIELSAVESGVKDIKKVMSESRTLSKTGTETLLFVDEIHRFSKAQQDALLPGVENRDVTFIAATTENPSFSVIRPLLSRSIVVKLNELSRDSLSEIIDKALASENGLDDAFSLSDDARKAIIRYGSGDARKTLSLLEASASGALSSHDGKGMNPVPITEDDVRKVLESGGVKYDRNGDDHYDMASAFIKSMRGSDPDAAVYWAARMLRGGEDPRFIARRVVIAAAEEVGLASPQTLQIAVAAAQACDMVGMPEARIPLSEAIIAVSVAPKSNAAYMAMDKAMSDIDAGMTGPVPLHLRNATNSEKRRAGYGDGYKYAHDEPEFIAHQQYLPDGMEGVEYYTPKQSGREVGVAESLEHIRAILHDGYDGDIDDDGATHPTDHEKELWRIGRQVVKPKARRD